MWAIDPIDGTTNFVNGFPLFAASIGVLHGGRPLVGAVWCSTSHALRAGVYHARAGGALCFEGEPLVLEPNESVRRHLAGEPRASADNSLPWDVRKTGSAAIECAFVAAGLLRVARFAQANIWDVAGGAALVRATAGDVRTKTAQGWITLERFEIKKSPAAAFAAGVSRSFSASRRRWRASAAGTPESAASAVWTSRCRPRETAWTCRRSSPRAPRPRWRP